MKRHVLCVSSLVVFGGCYNSSFVRNDGPVRGGGVTIEVVGQRCDFSPDFTASAESSSVPNRLDLGIRVAIENDGQGTIMVAPENLRLIVGGAPTAPASPPQPFELLPGATRKLNLQFEHQGDSGCNASLSLALEKVVLAGARPVALRPVSFVPSSTDS